MQTKTQRAALGMAALLNIDSAAGQPYTEMDERLDHFGYTSSAFEATSEDGYISTIFQIHGDVVASKGSIVVMNGTMVDAYDWFSYLDEQTAAEWGMPYQPDYRPTLLDVVDAGYDVWVAGLRGSGYNLGHTSKDWQ